MVNASNQLQFDTKVFNRNISRLINQVYKILPLREESQDWKTPLKSCILEVRGLNELFYRNGDYLILLTKLEGIQYEEDFYTFRKTVFECLNLLQNLKVVDEQ